MRSWRIDDREPFADMNSDEVVMEHFPGLLAREESDAFVERARASWQRGFGLWAVEWRETESFIGYIGFAQPQWHAHFTPCIEIGWRLCAASWGRGLATEGASAALAWARGNIVFPRDEVVSFTTVANLRSRRVMEKLGLVRDETGDFDHPLLPQWPHRRHVLYRMPIESGRLGG